MRSFIVIISLMLNSCLYADTYMIGDSVFAHRGGEIERLVEEDRGISIISHAKTGAWFWQIVKQFEGSGADAGDVVIMDGGGNDVFGNSSKCRHNFTDGCRAVIQDVARQMSSLLIKMRGRMISRVIFVTPYYTTGWMGSGYDKAVDYGVDLFTPICSQAPIPCTLIDGRPLMKGPVFEWDGIHPNQNGTRALSKAISSEL